MGKSALLLELLAVCAVILSGFTAQSQPLNPAYVPPYQRASVAVPVPSPVPAAPQEDHLHPGRYQTLDGKWHAARINDWQHDRVVLHDEGDPLRQLVVPENIKRFVRDSDPDTVVTVSDFVLPGRHQVERPVFARQVLRGRGLVLYEYNVFNNRDLWEVMLLPHQGEVVLLRQGTGPVQVLPHSPQRLQALLLAALADDPVSVTKLQAEPLRLWRDVIPLLQGYIERQGVAQTAHK